MSKTLLIMVFTIATIATAEPYFSTLPARSLYGTLYPSSYSSTVVQGALPALVQEPVPAVVPGTLPAVLPASVPATVPAAAAYTSPELASYAYGDYNPFYGISNLSPLASPYSVPPYGYAYGNYFYRR